MSKKTIKLVNPLSSSLTIPVINSNKTVNIKSNDIISDEIEVSSVINSYYTYDITPSIELLNPTLLFGLLQSCSPQCSLMIFELLSRVNTDKRRFKETITINREELSKTLNISLKSIVKYIKELSNLSIIYPVAGKAKEYWINPNYFYQSKGLRMTNYPDKIISVK